MYVAKTSKPLSIPTLRGNTGTKQTNRKNRHDLFCRMLMITINIFLDR